MKELETKKRSCDECPCSYESCPSKLAGNICAYEDDECETHKYSHIGGKTNVEF